MWYFKPEARNLDFLWQIPCWESAFLTSDSALQFLERVPVKGSVFLLGKTNQSQTYICIPISGTISGQPPYKGFLLMHYSPLWLRIFSFLDSTHLLSLIPYTHKDMKSLYSEILDPKVIRPSAVHTLGPIQWETFKHWGAKPLFASCMHYLSEYNLDCNFMWIVVLYGHLSICLLECTY